MLSKEKKLLKKMGLYYIIKINKKYLQGRVKVPTGGIAREQFLQIRCNSEADSKVWMKEDHDISKIKCM